MDKADIIREIQWRVPFFKPTPEWVEDELTYLVIDDLARYICIRQKEAVHDEVHQALNCLEFILSSGYPDARSLVMECLEGLRECTYHHDIKAALPPELLNIWANYIRY